MYSILCGLTCIHDYNSPHEISAFTYFDTKKMAEFLSSTLGSALSTFCFSSFRRILLSTVLVSISQSSSTLYSKPKKCSWNTVVFIWIKMETNTLMAHKSRWCLDIFLCLHFVNNSSFFVFIQYYFASLQDYVSFFLCYHYMWISPRMLYIQYVDMHLYFFCIFQFGQ